MTRPEWTAEPFVPKSRSLKVLEKAALACTGCPLHQDTTQTVFGAGARDADIVLVGEQPGDQEDKRGEPFVGPAGRVLWQCVERAQIDRARLYVTNAVKHFKHETHGKRRLHKKPTTLEAEACHPWLEAELEAVEAKVIVALGAVAARSLVGRTVSVTKSEGETYDLGNRVAIVTYHPSAALRAEEEARAIRHRIVVDLERASRMA
jgi:DNA polymerase